MPAWVPVVWLPSSGVEMGNGGVVSTPPSPGRVRGGVGVNGRRKLPILGVPRPYNPQFLIFRFEILVLVLVEFYTVFKFLGSKKSLFKMNCLEIPILFY